MKLGNEGFTVVELLTSFTLTMIIVIFLFEIVLEFKDIYVTNALKVKVMTTNAIVATTLNDKLKEKNIINRQDECYNSNCTIYDNTGNWNIEISNSNNTQGIIIAGQKIAMPKNTTIENADFSIEYLYDSPSNDNAYIKISYTVKSKDLNEDIPFNYIYSFHTDYWAS